MSRFLLALTLAFVLQGEEAESDWKKVMALTKGTDVRIAAKGVKSPIEGKVDQVNEEAIVVILRDEQRSILLEEIDRLDYRNMANARKLTKESRVSSDDTSANPIPPGQRAPGQSAVPKNMGAGTSVMLPSKAPWEPLYKRAKGKQ